MRITQESDYALRIITVLASHTENRVDAGTLAEETGVTPRFTLKILHKLVSCGMVSSAKGAYGGYHLLLSPEDISLKDVIERIDGPIAIARCLSEDGCTLGTDKTACIYHHIFDDISIEVGNKLAQITIADVLRQQNQTI